MSLSWWPSMIQAHAWQYCWNSEAKHPWRSWGNLSLSQTSGPWWFWSWIRGMDPTKRHQVIWDINLNGQWTATARKEIIRMLSCSEEILKEKKGSCLARLPCIISSSHLQGLVHHHMYWWTVEMMKKMTHPQFKRKTSFLNCYLFVRYCIFLQIFHK